MNSLSYAISLSSTSKLGSWLQRLQFNGIIKISANRLVPEPENHRGYHATPFQGGTIVGFLEWSIFYHCVLVLQPINYIYSFVQVMILTIYSLV